VKGKAKSKNTGYIGIQDTGVNKIPDYGNKDENLNKENENS
jgi:hypothetical protein